MLQRMIRAARLDVDLYESVEHDRGYTGEAFTIVVVTALLWGIGQWALPNTSFWGSVVGGLIGAVVGWVIWAIITNIVGRQLGGTSDTGEMLRVLGYASSPMALGIIPAVGHFVGGIWALVAAVVAVRQGQDFSTGKAVATILIGWIVYIVARGILGWIF
ncbi:MAG: YIP1 family protein [Acidimicrobiia bacterium]|nr:YIP1 family protein [Acidimicrobiia bacterium]